MLTPELTVLTLNAVAVGFIHTAIGPDHYVPFIVMAKARGWSLARTTWITLACGIGHVASSVLLGLAGYAVGASLRHLEWIESFRGEIAAWALIIFGALYAAWGLWRIKRKGPDGHSHDHLIRLHDPVSRAVIQIFRHGSAALRQAETHVPPERGMAVALRAQMRHARP